MRMEINCLVFLQFHPTFFSPFSLSFPPFSFAFPYAFRMLGHLIDVNGATLRKYNGKPNIFGSKF